MRQNRKPDAGKYKHNDAEHPIWIIDRRTCSLICFVLQCGPKRYLTFQLLRFSFVLDQIVHLPVPSENVNRRGKKISKSLAPTTGTIAQMGPGAERFSEKSKRRWPKAQPKLRCSLTVPQRTVSR
jgi:hypothetical protein